MSYRIEYSPIAIRDLDRVYAEVLEASKDMDIALRYIDDLMDQVAAKGEFPKSGSPLYYEGGFTGYYFVVFKAYMAFYRVDADRMYVDRVVYGRSDYMRSIFKRINQ
ncbi:MAG: type II toxin-antitoxin system RelE/ParE family toxin [Eubacteriales bacterium]|nr:type II toxin-antitoxin system RelE/ParE family toxin [Eubacteriales bacterium]